MVSWKASSADFLTPTPAVAGAGLLALSALCYLISLLWSLSMLYLLASWFPMMERSEGLLGWF
jgi:hypothetical protein